MSPSVGRRTRRPSRSCATKSSLPADLRTALPEARTRLGERVRGLPAAARREQERPRAKRADHERPERTALSLDSRRVDCRRREPSIGSPSTRGSPCRSALNLQPGQRARRQRPRSSTRRSRARSRGRPTPPARATSTSSTPTSTCVAPTSSTPPRTMLGWSPPWLVKRLDDLGREGGALLAITGNPEPELFADLDGGRVAQARMRERRRGEPAALPTGSATGRSSPSRTRAGRRTVFGEPDVERLWQSGRDGRPARRAGSGRGLARAHRRPRPARGRPERPAVRRTPLPRPGHRPDGRPAPGLGLASRRSTRSRGIEHVANMPTEEVFTPPDARRVDGTVRATLPAAAPGDDRPRPRGALRGRPRRRGARRRGRGADAHARRDRRRAPRGSARSRSSTAAHASAGRASSSTTRSSTRTPRRTSRSAWRSCRPSTARSSLDAGGAPRARHQPLVDPHRLHDRLARARRLRVDTRTGDEMPILRRGDWVLDLSRGGRDSNRRASCSQSRRSTRLSYAPST